MLSAWGVIAVAVVCAFGASYVIWRAASRSGLFALLAGVALAIVALVFAVLIALVMTWAWMPR